jgi:hypothetical protein
MASMGISGSSLTVDTATPGTPISGSRVVRMTPWGAPDNHKPNPIGAGPNTDPSASNTEVISLNNDIHTQMPGDARSNYFMLGSTWTANTAMPFHFPGLNFNTSVSNGTVVGTSHLANSTMETYVQSQHFVSGTFPGPGCFGCHGASSVFTDVSHIYESTKKLF